MPTIISHPASVSRQNAKSAGDGIPRRTFSRLTFSRNWLVHVASETLDIARNGKYVNRHGEVVNVGNSLVKAIENTVHFHSTHVFHPLVLNGKQYETSFHICYSSSLDAAARLENDGHIGILNSASGKNPGGKFSRGTVSQEDCICRASLLYPCLVQFKGRKHCFYEVNNSLKYRESSSSCAIFSPLVPVIRDDTVEGELLDTFRTYSFVSIPAPNAFVVGTEENNQIVPKAQKPGETQAHDSITLKEAMRDRIFRALCIFAEKECTQLILCAFGCGVHGNNPDLVARLFKDILEKELKGRFKTVVFAIQPSRHANYRAFTSVFPRASTG